MLKTAIHYVFSWIAIKINFSENLESLDSSLKITPRGYVSRISAKFIFLTNSSGNKMHKTLKLHIMAKTKSIMATLETINCKCSSCILSISHENRPTGSHVATKYFWVGIWDTQQCYCGHVFSSQIRFKFQILIANTLGFCVTKFWRFMGKGVLESQDVLMELTNVWVPLFTDWSMIWTDLLNGNHFVSSTTFLVLPLTSGVQPQKSSCSSVQKWTRLGNISMARLQSVLEGYFNRSRTTLF